MNVSKTLKSYIEQAVEKKHRAKQDEAMEERKRQFEKVRQDLDKLYCEHVEKARALLESVGLNPDEYGYSESGPAFSLPGQHFPMRYRGVHYKDVTDDVNKIILKIELDEIPKNEIMAYIDSYEPTFRD